MSLPTAIVVATAIVCVTVLLCVLIAIFWEARHRQ